MTPAPLDALETKIRWSTSSEVRIGLASCVRWSCPADALRFDYGQAETKCKGCGNRYTNEGDRARLVRP